MAFKGPFNAGKMGDDLDEDLIDEDHYASLKKRRTGLPGFLKNSGNPFVLAGIGLIVIVLLIVSLVAKPRPDASEAKFKEIESNLLLLQDKVSRLEALNDKLDRLDAEQKKLEQFTARLNQLEESSSQRINHIARALDALQKQATAATTRPAAPESAPKPAAKPAPQKPTVRFHQISRGETLYSISRRHGIPLETLLKLNQLKPDAKIFPGQKIVLGPPGG